MATTIFESATSIFRRKRDKASIAGQEYSCQTLQQGFSGRLNITDLSNAATELFRAFNEKQNRPNMGGLIVARTAAPIFADSLQKAGREEGIGSIRAYPPTTTEELLDLYKRSSGSPISETARLTIEHARIVADTKIRFTHTHIDVEENVWELVGDFLGQSREMEKQLATARAALILANGKAPIIKSCQFFMTTWPSLNETDRMFACKVGAEAAAAACDLSAFTSSDQCLLERLQQGSLLAMVTPAWNLASLMAAQQLEDWFNAQEKGTTRTVFFYNENNGQLLIRMV